MKTVTVVTLLVAASLGGCSAGAIYEQGQWGGYGLWETTQECAVSCGGGTTILKRWRDCIRPNTATLYICVGNSEQTAYKICNEQPCPGDGGWSNFDPWVVMQKCPVTCGAAKILRSRKRTCTNPRPAYDGRPCIGMRVEYADYWCNVWDCPGESTGLTILVG